MTFFAKCAVFLACVSIPSYAALQILLLVRSIQAIVGKDGLCSDASFRWVWFICIASALSVNSMIQNRDRVGDGLQSVQEFAGLLAIMVLASLGFALGTQLQYLDGCPSGHYAYDTMYIYMWGNYAVVASVMLIAALTCLDVLFEKPEPEAEPV